jgi:hypothetical protein
MEIRKLCQAPHFRRENWLLACSKTCLSEAEISRKKQDSVYLLHNVSYWQEDILHTALVSHLDKKFLSSPHRSEKYIGINK